LRRTRKYGYFSPQTGYLAAYTGGYVEDFLQKVHILADCGAKFVARPIKEP
jgi:hypothetical protein